MSIIITILALIGVGAILQLINQRLSLKGKTAVIINVIVLGLALLWLLYAFGFIQLSGEMKMPFPHTEMGTLIS